MRVAERHREPAEAHFTEGEPDLEPPEELAVVERDEEAILEEDLDNEDVLEQDVDEDTLEVTLEDLIHDGDDDEDEAVESRPVAESGFAARAPRVRAGDGAVAEDAGDGAVAEDAGDGAVAEDAGDGDDTLDGTDGDDLEAELDVVLLERLALVEHGEDGAEDGDASDAERAPARARDGSDGSTDVAPCGIDEFVCPSCFLVRKRVQLVGAGAPVCRDCA